MRIEKVLDSREATPPKHGSRRGLRGQRSQRQAERVVRRSAVVFGRWSQRCGDGCSEAAERVGVAEVTLRRWQRVWRQDRMALQARGRPAPQSDRSLRKAVIELFALTGPGLGLPTLIEQFPDASRGELAELQRRYRDTYRWRRRGLVHELRWRKPGRVWSADFSEVPEPIDGAWKYLLAVRDLGASEQLEALPVEGLDGRTAREVFETLFQRHGAPLVMKLDNGSAFIAAETKDLFARWGVRVLYSPPRTPEFNGAIEAGIGGLKVRIFWEAARHGRAGQPTCDDVEAARLSGNHMARPRGLAGPSPDQLWQARSSVSEDERAAFLAGYRGHEWEERIRRGIGTRSAYSHFERASIDRIAIVRALLEGGYLEFRRRRVRPPIRLRKAS